MEEQIHSPSRRKVDYPIFVWVITILSSVMLTISGYLFSEITRLRTDLAESAAENKGLVRELSARLDAEREKNTGILVTLAEIKGDVKLVKDKLDQQLIRR